jgi:hypothetical protein
MQHTHCGHSFIGILTAGLLALGVLAGPGAAHAARPTTKPQLDLDIDVSGEPHLDFDMVVSGGAATCLPDAQGEVHVVSLGPVEVMKVAVKGLPPNTDFDFFVIQLPVAPFGLAWYQGDIETDDTGHGHQIFIGRFNIETFIVAQPPGNQPAPVVHDQPPFPDAKENPATEPVHTFHLGLWFNSPADAEAAGCPNTVTRFNGEHNAGIQVLNTNNFPPDHGPLRDLQP